jgi:hypothetical protein
MKKCLRCGHTWSKRTRECPSCKSTAIRETGSSSGLLFGLAALVVAGVLIAVFAGDYAKEALDKVMPGSDETPAKTAPDKKETKAPAPAPPPPAEKREAPESAKGAPAAAAPEAPAAPPPPATEAPPEPDPEKAKAEAEAEKKRLEQEAREKAADRMMNLAKNYEVNNLREQAIKKYREVVEKYPGTGAANYAKLKIEELTKKQ